MTRSSPRRDLPRSRIGADTARFAIDLAIQVAQLLLSFYGVWLAWQVLLPVLPGPRRPTQHCGAHPRTSSGTMSAIKTVSPHSAGAEPSAWLRRALTRSASASPRLIHHGSTRETSR